MTKAGVPRTPSAVANAMLRSMMAFSLGSCMSCSRRGTSPDWFHSDQGSEYAAASFAELLALHGTSQSMSRKGCPWQNGFQESFYANFKLELGDPSRLAHEGELVEAVNVQLAYYNRRRIHSALGMPPVEFRKRQEQKIAAFAAPTNLTIYPPAVLVKNV